MRTRNLHRLLSLGVGFGLVVACGDDGSTDSTAGSATESTTMSTETDPTVSSATMTTMGTVTSTTDTTTMTTTTDSTSTTDTTSTTDPTATGTDTDPTATGTDTDPTATSTGTGTGTGTTGGAGDCQAPGMHLVCDQLGNDDPFNAIGLNCMGDPNNSVPIANESFNSPDATAWQVGAQFGTFIDQMTMEPIWGPSEGEQFLLISTGLISAPDNQGVITMTPGIHETGTNNNNPDNQPLPAPMSHLMGSNNGMGGDPFNNCDFINDCSDSLFDQWVLGGMAANDLLWFDFTLDVPIGTFGYEFDFAYFSAEFPEWVDTTFNDIFVVWSTSESYTGNLCFVDDQPCTVTALWPVAYQEFSPELANTGFDGVGGGTGWYVAKGSAEPEETFELTWAVFDMGDGVWDTAVLIDNWRWDCEGCVPSEVDSCGIEPQ